MEWIGVVEAADELELSPQRVRQLIEVGRLGAVKGSGRWLIHRDSIDRLGAQERRAGRPWSSSRAWALLALASGHEASWLPPAEVDRLRAVLAARDIRDLVPQLRRRADRQQWYVHPGLVPDMCRREGVVVSGARASHRLRDSGPVDVYVHPAVVGDLVADFAPDVQADEPNVVVHVVAGPWPFAPGEREAWPPLVAVDLLERGDPRSRGVAEEILAGA